MFLGALWVFQSVVACKRWRIVVGFICSIIGGTQCLGAAESGCRLETPVYDAFGKRLAAKVVRISPDGKPMIDLLSSTPKLATVHSQDILFIDRSLLRHVINVTVEYGKGRMFLQPILLAQCPQRSSIRVGESETYGDFAFVSLQGQASGCGFDGDWWIRAMPMFGSVPSVAALEGYLERDGSFKLSGQMHGERHLLIFGRGEYPVMSVGVNVTIGKLNDVGIISLGSSCPKP
jgi:hypothetical protein